MVSNILKKDVLEQLISKLYYYLCEIKKLLSSSILDREDLSYLLDKYNFDIYAKVIQLLEHYEESGDDDTRLKDFISELGILLNHMVKLRDS